MQVTTSGPQTIQKALGETVTLGCTYTLGPEDTGVLDIEWSNVSPDMTQKDQLLLSYTGGLTMRYGDPSVNKRLKFIVDPKQGDASVSLSNLVLKDTATYQCKVKKAPGVDMRKVTLNVMVPPTSPKCWVEGPEEKGGPVSLLCKSYQGSIPLSYTWRRESGGAIPADAIQNLETGELLIKNHTDGNIGSYTCEVKNAVGKGQCKYALHAYNPTNKRRYEKEVENEIREDAPAPESRPTSRPTSRNSSIHSSLRSVMAYRTHPGVQYSSVRKQLPSVSESAHGGVYTGESNGRSQPNTAGGRASLNYDNRFGYPV
ncbi:Coxsackievirus and adenovirus receptor like [Dissostichus eleginoides]|uniref:Coxsackievirus and adenovirus receptor like n=1 Tax=Dissostichus eleginoides TaxID=100907 RepID=A0AAD9FBL0_DISEL|nr:Coxsackievirus and adenovirus receptor like [Dissostichus eleginoides]